MDTHACVLPGQFVSLLLSYDGIESVPVKTMVVKVMPGALIVYENESMNGLARIVVHGSSHQDGRYWYQFDRIFRDVTLLCNQNGEVIKTPSFIS